MSTSYVTLKKIKAKELFDTRLEAFGVREHFVAVESTESWRCLTDGRNFRWVSICEDGIVGDLTRYHPGGAPGKILNAVAEAFDTDIVSEYEPQYWGFDTQEEWDARDEQISKEHEERFHNELLKFLHGEPNDIRPGTIGMIWAEIAKNSPRKIPRFWCQQTKTSFARKSTQFTTMNTWSKSPLAPRT
jgi:hypothetical protein